MTLPLPGIGRPLSRLGSSLAVALLLSTLSACAGTIPNTNVEDTAENREVVEFLERYRRAVERRDVRSIMEMTSPYYLDDNGTPVGDDDLDYRALRDRFLLWAERVLDVRYDIRYRRVRYLEDRIMVEFRMAASFRLRAPDGDERWFRRLGDHAITLIRERDTEELRIVSGL